VLADVDGVLVDTSLIWIQPSHERGSTRTAEWKLAIGVFESNSTSGESIDIWRSHQRMTIATKVTVQVIADEKQNIWLTDIGCGAGTKGPWQKAENDKRYDVANVH